ncbi:MAG: sulfotransferase family 2 domain-containing protein [Balneolaceae bacterium]|nr:sulfotransferase family 2 domain-containing protein [Balneolaceae bacterium]MCH8549208.1 sulfotransferase family protein [Balneolaceae bacterium]
MQSLRELFDVVVCQLSHWKNRDEFGRLRSIDGDYTLEGFDRLQCIYVHIPKTAGIAINEALYGNYGWAHRPVRHYKRIFGPLTYKKYFTFTFVRNPYTRLLSAFRFLKNGGFGEPDRRWAEKNIMQYDTVNDFVMEWLNEESMWSYPHFKPQYSFVCDISEKPEVDFIGKFENIDQDFDKVCSILGIENRLKVRNKGETDNSNWREDFTNQSIEKVTELYRYDFKVFSYQPHQTILQNKQPATSNK